jgi:hypothetical protein
VSGGGTSGGTALPEILNPHQDGYHDTADSNAPETPAVGDLATSPIRGPDTRCAVPVRVVVR